MDENKTLVTLGLKKGNVWYLYHSKPDCVNVDGVCFAVVDDREVGKKYQWAGQYMGFTMLIEK